MVIKKRFFTSLKLFLLVFGSQVAISQASFVYAQGDTQSYGKQTLKTDLQDKHYRQSLYYYFQGNADKALASIEQSKDRLSKLDSRSSLFEAGLQLSSGLLQPAKLTLVNFDTLLRSELADEQKNETKMKASTKADKLRLVALLSLTDQYLQQGNVQQAQDTLSKITTVSATYYPAYHVLSQLAYWPEKVNLLPLKDHEGAVNSSSPYIMLNDALFLIEQTQYEQAIALLNTIKVKEWHEQEADFWRTLFLKEEGFSSQQEEEGMIVKQAQAIQDYAKLLLAQIYISQQRYQLAYNELQTFPEKSPYSESALFLFAFASQQIQQYSFAFNLLTILYKQYPHSSLGWQAAELLAQQVSEQKSLEQGVTVYQDIEAFFLKQQKNLSDFALSFKKSTDLLKFSRRPIVANKSRQNDIPQENKQYERVTDKYQPESIWLQQALFDAELANHYQQLIDLDSQTTQLQALLEKTKWLDEIITLNQQRKQKIVEIQASGKHDKLFKQITTERNHLAKILNKQLAIEGHTEFANETEKQWLQRIENSHNSLSVIGDKKNTEAYQERLARVQGVLSWQLNQEYPARAWHHKKQLQQLNKAIEGISIQQQKVAKVAKSDAQLDARIQKHQASIEHLNNLLTQSQILRDKVTIIIRKKVARYVEEQGLILAGHILTTRQGMAKVFEKMATADRRLSTKLIDSEELNQSNITSPNNVSSESLLGKNPGVGGMQ